MPAASAARTENLYSPGSSPLYFLGEVQALNCLSDDLRPLPLSLHSKVVLSSSDSNRYLILPVWLSLGLLQDHRLRRVGVVAYIADPVTVGIGLVRVRDGLGQLSWLSSPKPSPS